TAADGWVKAWHSQGSTNFVEFRNRIVLELKAAGDPSALLAGHALKVVRRVTDRIFILEAPATMTALREAESLGDNKAVAACYPVARRQASRHDLYARRPNDRYFYRAGLPGEDWQW